MKLWWHNLNLRERLILIAAAVVLSYIMLDSFVVQELSRNYQRLDEQVDQASDDLNWMRQAVQRLPAKNIQTRKIMAGRVVTFLDQQITRQGLKKNMQQMTPIQDHSARLRLSDIEFNRLLKFFTAIEGSIFIHEVRILPADKAGFVNVSLIAGNEQNSK